MSGQLPTLEEFLRSDVTAVVDVAPKTVIYMPGGSRRAAALQGMNAHSVDYVQWSRGQLIAAVDQLFRHGVQHVFTGAIVPTNWAEQGTFRTMLTQWARWVIAGPETLADYVQRGWNARILGEADVPELIGTDDYLRTVTISQAKHTLWWLIVTDNDAPWRWILDATAQQRPRDRSEAIRAVYGADVPLASLFIASGKPSVNPALIPPLLMGDLQCYWVQRPGYYLTAEMVRRIFYDAIYTRATWQADKTGRAEAARDHRDIWEEEIILGLGRRLGPHWYPALPGEIVE